MHAQQVLDGKKKAELEAACKGEQTTEAEKQRVSNGKIQENLQKINVLETNLKTSVRHSQTVCTGPFFSFFFRLFRVFFCLMLFLPSPTTTERR